MNRILITQVYASLLSLEKRLYDVKQMLSDKEAKHKDIEEMLPQYETAVSKMRRTANLLQLHIAKRDWKNIVRSMETFYGLSYMIRGDIMAAYGRLSRNEPPAKGQTFSLSLKEARYH
jgi:hypothetical protein